MRLFVLFLPFIAIINLSACAVRTSNVQFSGGTAKDAVPATCGWATVSETTTKKFLGLPLGTSVRQFDDALFLCCPGEDNAKPICREAKWMALEGAK